MSRPQWLDKDQGVESRSKPVVAVWERKQQTTRSGLWNWTTKKECFERDWSNSTKYSAEKVIEGCSPVLEKRSKPLERG